MTSWYEEKWNWIFYVEVIPGIYTLSCYTVFCCCCACLYSRPLFYDLRPVMLLVTTTFTNHWCICFFKFILFVLQAFDPSQWYFRYVLSFSIACRHREWHNVTIPEQLLLWRNAFVTRSCCATRVLLFPATPPWSCPNSSLPFLLRSHKSTSPEYRPWNTEICVKPLPSLVQDVHRHDQSKFQSELSTFLLLAARVSFELCRFTMWVEEANIYTLLLAL